MNDRIDFDQVREVIRIAAESDVAELEVETPSLKVRVRKAGGGGPVLDGMASAAATHPSDSRQPATSLSSLGVLATDGHLEPLVAPMVGTFYRSPSPEAPPFVKEGDVVQEGQVVCIIEAMKLFNEIQAEKRGRVAKVMLENASPVEFGQPLFLLDTSDSAVRG